MYLKTVLLFLCSFFAFDVFSQTKTTTNPFIHDIQTSKKPWTTTDFQNDEADFNFAVMADRTNGHRVGIFEKGIDQLNKLSPEFVISVGDFIEGYTTNRVKLDQQWSEFRAGIAPLSMPFFMVPGNHDFSNAVQDSLWKELYGRDYYYFLYKNVLFLILNTNDGDGTPLTQQQISYMQEVLEKNDDVRWTFLFMHHPVWNKAEENGFDKIEASLGKRNYTVVAGHTHSYLHATRHNQNYVVLGTTGGASSLRGSKFGETDHIGWFSMKGGRPTMVNLELDGILDHDFSNEDSQKVSRFLIKDAKLNPFLLLSNQENEDMTLYLTLNNQAEEPLRASLKFYQHPYLVPSVMKIDTVLAPRSESVLKVDFENPSQHPLNSKDSLEWDWSFYYQSKNELPSLKGNSAISLVRSIPELVDKSKSVFTAEKEVKLSNPFDQSMIRYTLDGTEPTLASVLYKEPFSINQTQTLRMKVFSMDGKAESQDQGVVFNKVVHQPSVDISVEALESGLGYKYYEGIYKKVPDFSTQTSLKEGVTKDLNIDDIKDRQNNFALLIEGYVLIEQDDLYNFYLTSDDGCNLYIDDNLIVDNDGSHSALTKSGFVALKKGLHSIRFEYFEDFDGELIQLEYESEHQIRNQVPYSSYFRKKMGMGSRR